MSADAPSTLHESLVSLVSLGGSAAERALARSQVCAEVMRDLAPYVPHAFPDEPRFLADLRQLSFDEVREHLRGNKDRAYQFGTWRALFTSTESANAARLSVLGWVVHSLIELRAYFEPEAVDLAIARVCEWVLHVWMTEVPLEGDLRRWSTRATQNLRALPACWRGL